LAVHAIILHERVVNDSGKLMSESSWWTYTLLYSIIIQISYLKGAKLATKAQDVLTFYLWFCSSIKNQMFAIGYSYFFTTV